MSNPGWYDDGSGRQRWWDGQRWTEHFAPQQHALAGYAPKVLEVRGGSLAQNVAGYVRSGWRVESQGDGYAVLVSGTRPNHILHLLLTLFTAGLWAIVWIIVALSTREVRRTLQVGPQGSIITT